MSGEEGEGGQLPLIVSRASSQKGFIQKQKQKRFVWLTLHSCARTIDSRRQTHTAVHRDPLEPTQKIVDHHFPPSLYLKFHDVAKLATTLIRFVV